MTKTPRILPGLEEASTLGALHRSDALTLQEVFDTKALQQVAESTRLTALALQESPATKALQQMTKSVRLQEASMVKALQQATKSIDWPALTLQESPAMKALREFSNLPFNSAVRERVFSELDSLERIQPDPGEHPDFPVDQDIQLEIQRELEGNKDYKALSERTQAFLLYVYHYYLLPILINCIIVPMIIAHAQRVQTELQENKTPAEIRSYVRKPVHGVNKELLKGYRVVTGSNVHLRKEPSMRSKIITKLPSGKLIKVQDKSKRSWLLVEVDIEGERFVGWISRRYTTYFK